MKRDEPLGLFHFNLPFLPQVEIHGIQSGSLF